MLSESVLFSQLINESPAISEDAARYAVANCHADWYEYAFTKAAILAGSNYRSLDGLTATLTGTEGFTRPQAAYAVAGIAAIRAVTIFS